MSNIAILKAKFESIEKKNDLDRRNSQINANHNNNINNNNNNNNNDTHLERRLSHSPTKSPLIRVDTLSPPINDEDFIKASPVNLVKPLKLNATIHPSSSNNTPHANINHKSKLLDHTTDYEKLIAAYQLERQQRSFLERQNQELHTANMRLLEEKKIYLESYQNTLQSNLATIQSLTQRLNETIFENIHLTSYLQKVSQKNYSKSRRRIHKMNRMDPESSNNCQTSESSFAPFPSLDSGEPLSFEGNCQITPQISIPDFIDKIESSDSGSMIEDHEIPSTTRRSSAAEPPAPSPPDDCVPPPPHDIQQILSRWQNEYNFNDGNYIYMFISLKFKRSISKRTYRKF
jgi:hypothetical protein